MADQVNPTGSLATGIPLSYPVAKPSQPLQEKPPTAKPSISQAPKDAGLSKDVPSDPVSSAAQAFSEYLQSNQPNLVFQVDKTTGEPYFKIVDAKTQKVIRQVPSEEVLAMARKLRELADSMGASGVLVDKVG
jgi:flagellar protein FlaG